MRLTMLSGLWKRFETCRGIFVADLKFWKNKSWICLGFVEVIIAGMRIWSWILRLRNRVKPPKHVKHFIVVNVIVPWRSHLVRGGGGVTEGFSALFRIMLLGPFLCLFTPENISSMVRFSCFAIFCWLWLLWICILWLLSLLLWSCQNLFNFKIVRVCQHCVSFEVAKSRLIVTALPAPWASCKDIKPEIQRICATLYNSLQHGTGEAGRLTGIWIGDFACQR